MKAAAFAVLLLTVPVALPAAAQTWGHPDQVRSWSSAGRHGDYNGQQDRPGDYRCDAYWDRAREDCDARWRDQPPFRAHGSSRRFERLPYYGGFGSYAYQPYGQGVQYYGAYGRPDQVYPGSGYGGRVVGYSGGGHADRRDPGRSAYCASRYRSYDPVSGYYRAYSGRLVFCG